jgi:hypothetical protein
MPRVDLRQDEDEIMDARPPRPAVLRRLDRKADHRERRRALAAPARAQQHGFRLGTRVMCANGGATATIIAFSTDGTQACVSYLEGGSRTWLPVEELTSVQ